MILIDVYLASLIDRFSYTRLRNESFLVLSLLNIEK